MIGQKSSSTVMLNGAKVIGVGIAVQLTETVSGFVPVWLHCAPGKTSPMLQLTLIESDDKAPEVS